MGLGDNNGRLTYLNIKKGKISYKNKAGEAQQSDYIEGYITKIIIEEKTFDGKTYEEAKITILDGEDKYQLQMKVDSGYFRAFCNAFRSGNPQSKTKITPTFTEDGVKKQSGCFVEQNGTALKWFYSKANNNQKKLPELKVVKFKGEDHYDGTELLNFWKNWLLSLKFKEEIEAVSHSQPQNNGLNPTSKDQSEKENDVFKGSADDEDLDLPF